MPAYSPEAGYGLKTLVITPGNPAVGRDAHQGGVLLFDVSTGEPLALLNASAVTEIRTAAVSAVATHLLARPGAAELAVIGTGVRGRAHAHAIAATRPLTGIRLAGRDPARSRDVAAARPPPGAGPRWPAPARPPPGPTSYAASLLRSAITRPKFTTLTLYHSGIASGFDELALYHLFPVERHIHMFAAGR